MFYTNLSHQTANKLVRTFYNDFTNFLLYPCKYQPSSHYRLHKAKKKNEKNIGTYM